MGRHKGNKTKPVNFRLDVDIVQRLKELSKFECLTQSAFIELMILRWDEGLNPEIKLNTLINERKIADQKLHAIDRKINMTSEQITFFNDLKRQKLRKRPQAIELIKRHLEDQNFKEAERISRFWQKETGVSSIDLLMEARDQIIEKQKQMTLN